MTARVVELLDDVEQLAQQTRQVVARAEQREPLPSPAAG